MKKHGLMVALVMVATMSCTPAAPTPVPVPTPAVNQITCNNSGTNNVCNIGNTAPVPNPSASPTGLFPRPDYVKITQFGESCGTDKNGVQIQPSGQDRSVRIGCTKALTLSPKCHQATGPDVDCPVPDGAAPDTFEVTAGADHIIFSDSQASRFNKNAFGLTAGSVTITGAYAGVAVLPGQEFILTVVP
jgi:hypothetical protein